MYVQLTVEKLVSKAFTDQVILLEFDGVDHLRDFGRQTDLDFFCIHIIYNTCRELLAKQFVNPINTTITLPE